MSNTSEGKRSSQRQCRSSSGHWCWHGRSVRRRRTVSSYSPRSRRSSGTSWGGSTAAAGCGAIAANGGQRHCKGDLVGGHIQDALSVLACERSNACLQMRGDLLALAQQRFEVRHALQRHNTNVSGQHTRLPMQHTSRRDANSAPKLKGRTICKNVMNTSRIGVNDARPGYRLETASTVRA